MDCIAHSVDPTTIYFFGAIPEFCYKSASSSHASPRFSMEGKSNEAGQSDMARPLLFFKGDEENCYATLGRSRIELELIFIHVKFPFYQSLFSQL